MKNHTSLMLAAWFAFTVVGCSKRAPSVAPSAQPINATLGLVEVSDGVTTRQDVGNGLACIIKPTVLQEGGIQRVRMAFTFVETNSSGDKPVADFNADILPDISMTLSNRVTQSSRAISIHLMAHIKT